MFFPTLSVLSKYKHNTRSQRCPQRGQKKLNKKQSLSGSLFPSFMVSQEQNISHYVILILTFELAARSSTCKSQTLVSPNSVWGWELFTWIPSRSIFFACGAAALSHVTAYRCQRDASWRLERIMREGERKQVWGCCGRMGTSTCGCWRRGDRHYLDVSA